MVAALRNGNPDDDEARSDVMRLLELTEREPSVIGETLAAAG